MTETAELTKPKSLGKRHVELLDELEHLFHSEGYKALTVGELAARLNCSRSTLYDIAPSKRELFHFVLRRWSKRLREDARRAAAAVEDPFDKLVAVGEVVVYRTADESEAFLNDVAEDAVADEIVRRHIRHQVDMCMGFIKDGAKRGCFRKMNYRFAAELCISTAIMLRRGQLRDDCGLSLSEAYQEWLAIFMHGVTKP